MKILLITADGDYDALNFESEYVGQKVSDLITRVESGEILKFKNEDENDEYIDLQSSVVEVGDVDERFLDFVRNYVQDYDDSKHTNFYLENAIVTN